MDSMGSADPVGELLEGFPAELPDLPLSRTLAVLYDLLLGHALETHAALVRVEGQLAAVSDELALLRAEVDRLSG